MESLSALSEFGTWVAVHVFALHVDNDPAAAIAEIVYPSPHAEQSTSPSASHNVPSLPPLIVRVP